MKHTLVLVIAAVLVCAAVGMLCLAGCTRNSTPGSIVGRFANLAEGGEFGTKSGKSGESAVFEFGREVTFNTLVLKESGDNIRKFRVYADDGEEPFYGGDYVEGYHYGSFSAVTASSLRIEIESDGNWKLKGLEAYDISDTAEEDFEIMGYVTAQWAYSGGELEEEWAPNLQAVTHLNYISGVYFDSKGGLYFRAADGSDKVYGINDTTAEGVSAREAFSKGLENLRAYTDAKIVVTFLGNINNGTGEEMGTEERHNAAMTGAASDVLTENILAFVGEFGFDGVSFDYEYPSAASSFENFTGYLEKLHTAMDGKFGAGEKLLTAAISEWQLGTASFTPENLDILDRIEVMAYDLFDDHGNHSSFYSACYLLIGQLEEKGFDLGKINLGLPFYSRPENGDTFWGNYFDVAEELGEWDNAFYYNEYTTLEGVTASGNTWFNGRGMIYDKTCYAADCGLGGVMIWHIGTDSTKEGYRLMDVIAEAVQSRA